MRRLLFVSALSLSLAACSRLRPSDGAPPGPDTLREALMGADRAFAAETGARGLDGWLAHHAPDAARLQMGGTREAGTVVQGLDAVRAYDAGLFRDPSARLVWEPTAAGVFADGQHGFTTGRSAMIRPRDGAAPDTLFSGTYVTVWQRGADGRWRVILDTGA